MGLPIDQLLLLICLFVGNSSLIVCICWSVSNLLHSLYWQWKQMERWGERPEKFLPISYQGGLSIASSCISRLQVNWIQASSV